MIGVIAKPGQQRAVEEFFELFKTPWEFYSPRRDYDVVIATGDALPSPMPPLFVSYGADPKSIDNGVVRPGPRVSTAVVNTPGTLPIYTGLLTFRDAAPAAVRLTADAGAAAVSIEAGGRTHLRVGYDVFEEVRHLLSAGQPIQHASVPAIEEHAAQLRQWIVAADLPLIEVAPTPAGFALTACLTHDIDFVGIRPHKFDATMWGFVYRATVGGLRRALAGRLTWPRLLEMWRAVASLPLVYAGWRKDFWEPFEWYMHVERDLPATYYLIPFKGRAGSGASPRRAVRYDVDDIPASIAALIGAGHEIGVHGLDAWHDVSRGREELARIRAAIGGCVDGIRMHWLLRDQNTHAVLEQAGYAYDATGGYNETVGYRHGTTQVFRPLEATTLLELPLHVQDGALFFPTRLSLSDAEAGARCRELIDRTRRSGGVLTVLWHDRSHAAERFWGDVYVQLVADLKAANAWFGTASDVVAWFRTRRQIRFERDDASVPGAVRLRYDGDTIDPPVRVVRHRRGQPPVDLSWSGEDTLRITLASSRPEMAVSL